MLSLSSLREVMLVVESLKGSKEYGGINLKYLRQFIPNINILLFLKVINSGGHFTFTK
jgi:hypothetical protein